MSEMNEKIITEFLDLLKKVNNLEIIVQNINKDHESIVKKSTLIQQSMQESFEKRIKAQNAVVSETLNVLVNQSNSAAKILNERLDNTLNFLKNELGEDNGLIKIKTLEEKIENISNFLSSFGENYQLYKKSICKLNFTQRTINCLRSENIETVEDLLKWSELTLLKTPNLGRKSVTEIKCVLRNLGLKLHD